MSLLFRVVPTTLRFRIFQLEIEENDFSVKNFPIFIQRMSVARRHAIEGTTLSILQTWIVHPPYSH